MCASLLLAAPLVYQASTALALPRTDNPYVDRTYYDVQQYAGPAFAGAGTSVSISGATIRAVRSLTPPTPAATVSVGG